MALGLAPFTYATPLSEIDQSIANVRGMNANAAATEWNTQQSQRNQGIMEKANALWAQSGQDPEKFLAGGGAELLGPEKSMKFRQMWQEGQAAAQERERAQGQREALGRVARLNATGGSLAPTRENAAAIQRADDLVAASGYDPNRVLGPVQKAGEHIPNQSWVPDGQGGWKQLGVPKREEGYSPFAKMLVEAKGQDWFDNASYDEKKQAFLELNATKSQGAEQGKQAADPLKGLSASDRLLAKTFANEDGTYPPDLFKKVQEKKEKIMGGKGAPTEFKTFYQGAADQLAKEGITDPGEVARRVSSAWTAKQLQMAGSRGEAYVKARAKYLPMSVYDAETGEIGFATPSEIMGFKGKYGPAGQSDKVLARQATLGEIRNSTKLVGDSLKEIPEFTGAQAAQLANIFKPQNQGMLRTMVQQQLGTTLNEPQMRYAIRLANLEESAMALRQTQGLGQGSDMVREAVERMIPSASTPSKAYATQQLDTLINMLDVLQTGIPKLPGQSKKPQPGAAPAPGRFKILKVE